MHGGEPAYHRVISNTNVTAQCAVVGENDVIAHGAIVPDMTVSEIISAIANPCFALGRGAAVCGYEFAERVFVPNFQIRRFAAIFQILCLLPDGAVRVEPVFRSGLHWSAERDVMLQPAIWTKHYVRSDHAIRPDDCSCANFCSGINDRGWMNLHVAHVANPSPQPSPLPQGERRKKRRVVVWTVCAYHVTGSPRPS